MLFYSILSIIGVIYISIFVKETKNRNKMDLIKEYLNSKK